MDGNNYENNGQYSNYQDNTANIPQTGRPGEAVEKKVNGLQVAGLVCGILAICGCWCYGIFSVILGIAGLICSIMGNNRGKHGVGIAGLACSIIGLVLGIASLLYFIYVFMYLFSDAGSMDLDMLMKYWNMR